MGLSYLFQRHGRQHIVYRTNISKWKQPILFCEFEIEGIYAQTLNICPSIPLENFQSKWESTVALTKFRIAVLY